MCTGRQHNCCAGHGGNALAAACKAQTLGGCGLDSNAIRAEAQNRANGGLYGRAMRADSGGFGEDRHIDVDDTPTALGDALGRVFKE